MQRVLVISSDCHAGALPATYNEYMPRAFHDAANAWWLAYAREMYSRAGTFFDQEAVKTYAEQAGEGGARMQAFSDPSLKLSDADILGMLGDTSSPFAPRRGEFDATVRMQELDADGIAGEVIFPQMAPFGAGLMQYRYPVTPEQSFAGCQAYNRWLADFCSANPARQAGVALIDVEDIEATVREIRAARAMGLWGGVLLPSSTGKHPFYHHPRYEPIWAVCQELDIPVQSHSGWSPDYGDVPSATAMFISEVDMWAQRPFTAMLWAGVFERYPNLKYMLTETGVGWVVEKLRVLDFKAASPMFKHFNRGLSMTPSGYFARNCWLGASFMPEHEGRFRHQIGVDRLMWGSDYPHLEGTWPNTMKALNETFALYPEQEIRDILGLNAANAYGFDVAALAPVAERIGPTLSAVRGH
jgi:predicted TIM-barrel fold metal-dependent hydrolase